MRIGTAGLFYAAVLSFASGCATQQVAGSANSSDCEKQVAEKQSRFDVLKAEQQAFLSLPDDKVSRELNEAQTRRADELATLAGDLATAAVMCEIQAAAL